MDNRAGEMEVFLRVVDAGSFSEAARQMLMTPSSVSKLVGRIEARLGVRLLERSTRRLVLTAEGHVYAERSRVVLAELAQIERDLFERCRLCGRHGSGQCLGRVRSRRDPAPSARLLGGLSRGGRRPVALGRDRRPYLDRTDIAFRVGTLASSSLTALKLGSPARKIVAAPAYLARRGVPRTAEDLARHDCLGFNFRRSAPVWPLRESGRIVDRGVTGPLLANNGETVRHMALAGMGLARMGEFHIREDLRSGALVEVLGDAVEGDLEDVHALFLGGERLPHRIRVFLDFMVPRLRAFLDSGV